MKLLKEKRKMILKGHILSIHIYPCYKFTELQSLQPCKSSHVFIHYLAVTSLSHFLSHFHTWWNNNLYMTMTYTIYTGRGVLRNKLLFVLEIWKDKTDLLVTSFLFWYFQILLHMSYSIFHNHKINMFFGARVNNLVLFFTVCIFSI